jgi:hypothetical protein
LDDTDTHINVAILINISGNTSIGVKDNYIKSIEWQAKYNVELKVFHVQRLVLIGNVIELLEINGNKEWYIEKTE